MHQILTQAAFTLVLTPREDDIFELAFVMSYFRSDPSLTSGSGKDFPY